MNETIVFLNDNSDDEIGILAIGVHDKLQVETEGDAFLQLDAFLEKHQKWIFGYLGYDLKNELEDLRSENHDGLNFPTLFFFVPKVVYSKRGDTYEELISYDTEFSSSISPEAYLKPDKKAYHSQISFNSRTPKSDYLNNVESLLNHIQRGDIYEANYCVEFYKEDIHLAPLNTYWAANTLTNAPYSAFIQHDEFQAICGSPELYLEREGNTLTSKPIKGTRKRSEDSYADELLKTELKNDQKERSENVMIVDLVRNDLSRTALKDSVKVKELYGIYSFDTVHHMISTVTSQVDRTTKNTEILKSTFPMGSMTGAPKISALQLIEQHEQTKRGLYSGAIGYFKPDGDFTFNVVIRTLLYNSKKKYLSLMAGGAITANSHAESEYRECLLKAAALKKAIYEVD